MFTRTLIRPVVLAKSYGIAWRLRGSFRKKRLINALQNHVTEPVFWGWGTEREREGKGARYRCLVLSRALPECVLTLNATSSVVTSDCGSSLFLVH